MRRYKNIAKAYPSKRDALERIEDFHPIYYNYSDTEAKAQASRCLQCPIDILRGLESEFKFCRTGCPLGNNIPRWLKKTYEDKTADAFELANARSPFPEILGRICPKKGLCESSCTLEKTDYHAISIGNIEVFLNEKAFDTGSIPYYGHMHARKHKVALVGSGPASLSCATFLLRANIGVEIFEKESYVGGLLTYGIPNFKLHKHTILRRLEWMKQAGLHVHYNTEVGKDISITELLTNFDAIFLGMGAPIGRSAGMENEDARGVHQVMEILSETQKELFKHEFHQSIFKDKEVVVIGGGDSAMDALRTAIRHKAKRVTCVYRRDEGSMPGSLAEVINAKEEGVQFMFHSLPKKALVDDKNHVIGIEIARTYLNDEGKLQTDETQLTTLNADSIVLALGFSAKRFDFYDTLALNVGKSNTILVDEFQETNHPNVYAGGDVVRGADLAVRAALDGRTAAFAIAKRLGVPQETYFYM